MCAGRTRVLHDVAGEQRPRGGYYRPAAAARRESGAALVCVERRGRSGCRGQHQTDESKINRTDRWRGRADHGARSAEAERESRFALSGGNARLVRGATMPDITPDDLIADCALLPALPLLLQPLQLLELAAALQLARRHPGLSAHPGIVRTIDRLLARLRQHCAACPAILEVLRRGDDPALDVEIDQWRRRSVS